MSRRLTLVPQSSSDHIAWLNDKNTKLLNSVPVSHKIVDSAKPIVTFPDSSDVSLPLAVKGPQELVNYKVTSNPNQSLVGWGLDTLCLSIAAATPFPKTIYGFCHTAAVALEKQGKTVTPATLWKSAQDAVKRLRSSGKPAPSRSQVSAQIAHISSLVSPVKFSSSGSFSSNKQTSSSTMSKNSRNSIVVRNAPVARSVRVKSTNKPRMTTARGNIVVSHREMIGSLISSSTTLQYSSTSFVLNPGKASTFPWMSTLAQNYDKYVLRSFEVQLVSNQPTSTAGRIGVGIDYDSTDPLPADRVEFFNLTHHVEGAPWDTLSFKFPLDNKPRFVNSHTTTDSKLIDCGQLIFISDQIVATSTSLADIIISYSIELLEAQQAPLSTMHLWGSNITAFSALAVSGPVVGSPLATSSTTVFEVSLPAGCYVVYSQTYDGGAGSPGLAVAVHGGTGFNQSASTLTTTYTSNYSHVKITTNDGAYRFTLSVVALSALEAIQFEFTRISPAVFAAYTRMQAFTNVPSAIGTY